jgi:hypothetical protein
MLVDFKNPLHGNLAQNLGQAFWLNLSLIGYILGFFC